MSGPLIANSSTVALLSLAGIGSTLRCNTDTDVLQDEGAQLPLKDICGKSPICYLCYSLINI